MPRARPPRKRTRHPDRQIGFEVAQDVLHAQRIYLQRAPKGVARRRPVTVAQRSQTDIAEDAPAGPRARGQQPPCSHTVAFAQNPVEGSDRVGLVPRDLQRAREKRKAPFDQALRYVMKRTLLAHAQPENYVLESV